MQSSLKIQFFLLLIGINVLSRTIIVMAAPANPVAITLYPTGGWIQVVEELPVQDDKVYFELPAGAQLGSLLLSVEGQFIGSIETTPIASIDSPVVAKIRERYTKAVQEVALIRGKLAAVKAKIAFWSNPECPSRSIEEIKKFDLMMGSKIEELYVAESTIEPALKKALYELELLEKAIVDAGGKNTYATAITAVIRPDKTNKKPNKQVIVQYGYMLSDCGWNPIYRFDALPEKDIVQVVQEAEIRQASGQDWRNADITLASVNIGSALVPPNLPDWKILPAPIQTYRQGQEVSPIADNAMFLAKSSMPIVHAQEEPTFTTWSLGKVTVPAGMVMRFMLYKNDWDAKFFRLLRPSVQPHSYLVANIDIPGSVDLIPGSAQFMVDGKVVGNGYFTLRSEENHIYFGVDPRVTAQMLLDKSQSGRNGFLDKKQSHSWSWNIKVCNDHTIPVKVVVEEPEPQSGDIGIIITTESNPKPMIEDHMYLWKMTLPAEGKIDIQHSVLMTAPGDMRIIEGRR